MGIIQLKQVDVVWFCLVSFGMPAWHVHAMAGMFIAWEEPLMEYSPKIQHMSLLIFPMI